MRTEGVFQTLEVSREEHQRRGISFVLACVVQVLAVGLLALAGAWFPNTRTSKPARQYVHLTFPTEAEREQVLKAPTLPPVLPKLAPFVFPTPHVATPRLSEPLIHARNIIPRPAVQPPPKPPAIAETRSLLPPPVIQTGVFGQAPANPGGEKVQAKPVRAGGFGSPQGVSGQALGGNPGNVPKLGGFDLEKPPSNQGPGAAEKKPLVVADAGFGDRKAEAVIIDTADSSERFARSGFGNGGLQAGSSQGSANPPAVKTGAFGAPAQTPAKKTAAAEAHNPDTRPVEILSKPSPQYTAEARRLGVQGEVVLSVIFQADGTVKVVSVIRSLGHGLDQMAEQAAAQIRFKPAELGGKPTNFPATLHIEFRLA